MLLVSLCWFRRDLTRRNYIENIQIQCICNTNPGIFHLTGHCLTMRSQRTAASPAKGSASGTGTSSMSSMPRMMSGGRLAVSPHMGTVRKWVSSPARDGEQWREICFWWRKFWSPSMICKIDIDSPKRGTTSVSEATVLPWVGWRECLETQTTTCCDVAWDDVGHGK